ncbi:MAG TPA: hypothetical protein VF619_10395 [Allosphingosinicella sp.]|jgi:hypothetical protein
MIFVGSLVRACGALVLLSACGAGPATTTPAEASTPPMIWRDVAQVNVLCLVQTEAGVDQGALYRRICGSVRDTAESGSPAPVRIIAAGDPAVLAPDSVTLLVHASVQGRSGNGLLAFSIRPFRNSNEPMLFTSPPRAVSLAGPAGRASELEAALGAALSETLPWLSRPAGARPIR